MKKTQLWFTFVELIIVVVILGILWTVGFVSYSGYLWGVRDGNRIAQIKDIQKTLQVYSTNKYLPLPDDSVEITANGTTVGYQWYAGKNVLQQIQYTNGWVDPQDNTYFTYMISKNKKQFQVLTFLEESDNLAKEPITYLPWITQTYAADLSERYPKSLWAQLWVILQDTTNTPIQDIESGSVDIVTSGDDYQAVLSDTETLSGSGTLFTSLINNASCKRIQQLWKSKGSTTYNINPTGGNTIEVYCDMETDWGGWTRISVWAEQSQWVVDAGAFLGMSQNSSEALFWYTSVQDSASYLQAVKVDIPTPSVLTFNNGDGVCTPVSYTNITWNQLTWNRYIQTGYLWFVWSWRYYYWITSASACNNFVANAVANSQSPDGFSISANTGWYNNEWYFSVYIR